MDFRVGTSGYSYKEWRMVSEPRINVPLINPFKF